MAIVILAGFLLCSGTARATIVSGAFSGIIDGNTRDTYGLFGSPGADLSGLALTASYSYDTAAAFMYEAQPTSDAYLGIDNLTLDVSIGGIAASIANVTGSEIVDTQDGALTSVILANFAPTPLIEFALFAQGAWTPGATINAAFVLDPSDYGQTIYVSADGSHYDALDFAAAPAAVPEPPPSALLATALAAMGRLRRRGNGTGRHRQRRRIGP